MIKDDLRKSIDDMLTISNLSESELIVAIGLLANYFCRIGDYESYDYVDERRKIILKRFENEKSKK